MTYDAWIDQWLPLVRNEIAHLARHGHTNFAVFASHGDGVNWAPFQRWRPHLIDHQFDRLRRDGRPTHDAIGHSEAVLIVPSRTLTR